MQLHALHHVTMITGDAQANVAFYAETLGLRLLRQTADAPDAFHVYFGDATGSPGSVLSWYESPGATRGTAGAGMIHRIELGVGGDPALEFWKARFDRLGVASTESAKGLRFTDHDGLEFELQGDTHKNPPLVAHHPDIPAEHALQGIQGARAYARDPAADRTLLTATLGFDHKRDHEYVLGGGDRHVHWGYDQSDAPGDPGASTVHHIAWHALDADLEDWHARVRAAGVHVTDVRDDDYCRSVAFRTGAEILFECATTSPGFA